MLTRWLTTSVPSPSSYSFPVTYLSEQRSPDDQVLMYLAREIILAHGVPEMIKNEYQILVADAEDVGFDILKDYVEHEILPDPRRVMVRIGNFGEMLSAKYLVEFEGFWLPIYKLRYRDKVNWAARLTDLCVVKKDGVSTPIVCYAEVKTHSSSCNYNLAIEAHEGLATEDGLKNREILRFVCVWLYEKGLHEESYFLSSIRLGKLHYDRRHDLFLVHAEDSWDEEVLRRLDNHGCDPRLVDLSVKVIRVSGLRNVIDSAYAQAWQGARDIIRE